MGIRRLGAALDEACTGSMETIFAVPRQPLPATEASLCRDRRQRGSRERSRSLDETERSVAETTDECLVVLQTRRPPSKA